MYKNKNYILTFLSKVSQSLGRSQNPKISEMKNSLQFVLLAFAIPMFFLSSCQKSDECKTVCASNQILTIDCECVTLIVDPCKDTNCPTGFVCSNGDCIEQASSTVTKAGLLSTDETWKANKTYILQGKVVVPSGITLTIEPGTILKGSSGSGSLASALVVARGGKILAEGTADKPIIMTTIKDNIEIGQKSGTNLDEKITGEWGGLIILGKAPISAGSGAEAQIEGIPVDDTYGAYGGSDAADNSGVLKYVSVRHGGALIGEGNEINGITLGGVGSGTTIEFVEVIGNEDDGIEFFGGSVNVKNALVWAQKDDGYDVDQAYSGTIDGFIYIAGPDSDHALEIDGPENAMNNGGKFVAKNGYLKGSLTASNGEYADWRDNAQGSLLDSYFFNFAAGKDIELDKEKGVSSNYLAGKIIIKGNEFNLPDGEDFASIFKDTDPKGDDAKFKADMVKNNAATKTRTKGVNPALFSWTFAAAKGALADFK
jgi:hypothetical protein